MFTLLKKYLTKQPKASAPEAPYKVEAPAQPEPAKCGCGRSQSGLCTGLHNLSLEEWAVHADNPAKPKKPRAKKAPAEKSVAVKKPRAPKATK